MTSTPAQNTSEARFAAVKALYSKVISPKRKTSALINDILRYYDEHIDDVGDIRPDKKFYKSLIEGVITNIEIIDTTISTHLDENWKLDRLGTVMVTILRLATFELLHLPKTPYKVIIDEYVYIAASYFDEDEVSFVNAILDRIAREYRDVE